VTQYVIEGRRVLIRVDGYCQVMAVASTPGCAKIIAEALAMRASLRQQQTLMKSVTSLDKEPHVQP
jgi:hypothetical protein